MNQNKLFPTEIVEFSVENYFVKQHSTGIIIYIAVGLIVSISIIALPFVYVDVSTQSRGIIRAKQENNSIVCAVYGEVSKNRLKNNLQVQKGDTLVCLNTAKIDEEIKLNRQKIDDNSLFIADLQTLLYGGTNFNNSKYFSEYLLFKQKNKEKSLIVSQLKKEYELNKKLYANNAIAEFEFQQIKNKYELEESRLELMRKQKRNEWQNELNRYSLQNNELLSKIKQLEKEKEQYIISAPISGTITEYKGIKAGNYISPNQILAQISPNDELIVECYVQPKDIGLIHKNMKVDFQLDAFNYNQWGVAHGNVIEILEDIVNMENQAVFKVRCSLKDSYLQLKNGYKGKLKKGMTLTGRFKLTRRSLFDLLYDKVDDWLNPKTINTQQLIKN